MNRALVLIVLMVSAVAIAVVVVLAVGSGESEESSSRWTDPYAAVCRAASLAGAGKRVEARTLFFDDAHEQLHELARATNAEDRAQSAALLQAKEAVEAAANQPDADLATPLETLAAEVRQSVALVDAPVPGCGIASSR